MTHEQITLGGGGRDRGQALRSDPAALAGLRAGGRVLPMWRGRPLCAPRGLGWLSPDHPLLADAGTEVFLGLSPGGQGDFAADLSAWVPEDSPLPSGNFDPSVTPHPLAPADHAFADLRFRMTGLSAEEAEAAATARGILEWHRTHGFCAACGQASLPEQGGWQRRCPACAATHFPRTDPVVIMLVTDGPRALIGRSPGWPDGMYSCLAGFMEPGETVEAAVRREVAEETGVAVGEVRYVASQPWPFPASLMLGCIGQATSTEIRLDPAELEDALWITRDALVSVIAGTHPVIRAPRKGAIAEYLLTNWLADRL